LLRFIPGGSEAGDELDASSLGIAEEPVLACIAPVQRPASVPPTAVRTLEGEVVDLRRRTGVTAVRSAQLPDLRHRLWSQLGASPTNQSN
jgi:hypothetical protein